MRSADLRRENLRRIHKDRMRPLRVVEYLDNSAVFENSPVEIKEAFVISDRDTGEIFLTLAFRSMSEQPITGLEIEIWLYREQLCIPYSKLPFRYDAEEGTLGVRLRGELPLTDKQCRQDPKVILGEVFGQGVYLPLPDSYFHRLQIALRSVIYANGTTQTLDLVSAGRASRFDELDYALQATYAQVNIFSEAEGKHPIRVIPKAGENVWLCCCGHKNPASGTCCEQCGRDKDWQLSHLQPEQLRSTMQQLEDSRQVRILKDTSNYRPDRFMISKKEREEKEEQCHQVLERLAAIERARDHRQSMILPKILLGVGVVLLILFLLYGFKYIYFDSQKQNTPQQTTAAAAPAAAAPAADAPAGDPAA